jgi:hypothetical protein
MSQPNLGSLSLTFPYSFYNGTDLKSLIDKCCVMHLVFAIDFWQPYFCDINVISEEIHIYPLPVQGDLVA